MYLHIRSKTLGDGCSTCNPTLAIELLVSERNDLYAELAEMAAARCALLLARIAELEGAAGMMRWMMRWMMQRVYLTIRMWNILAMKLLMQFAH